MTHPNAVDLTNEDTYTRLAMEAMQLGRKFASVVRTQRQSQLPTPAPVVASTEDK